MTVSYRPFAAIGVAAMLLLAQPGAAQVSPRPAADQLSLLHSADPRLAANKRLVFDFWRIVLEGRHMEKAADYLAADYIQHNPTVASGRDGFVAAFSRMGPPQDYGATMKTPLIDIVAEGDLVVLATLTELDDPAKPGQRYGTTWFDMFRVADGKIVEHWDGARK